MERNIRPLAVDDVHFCCHWYPNIFYGKLVAMTTPLSAWLEESQNALLQSTHSAYECGPWLLIIYCVCFWRELLLASPRLEANELIVEYMKALLFTFAALERVAVSRCDELIMITMPLQIPRWQARVGLIKLNRFPTWIEDTIIHSKVRTTSLLFPHINQNMSSWIVYRTQEELYLVLLFQFQSPQFSYYYLLSFEKDGSKYWRID